VKFTAYASHTDTGRPAELSWDAFADTLTRSPPVIADPAQRPAFGPHVLKGPRLAVNVTLMTAQVFDYDRLTAEQAAQVIQRVSPFLGLVYTSYSHYAGKGIALRVILPRDDTPPAWRKHRRALESYIGVPSDPATHDTSRIFYIPAQRPNDPPPLILRLTGRPFDPFLLPGTRAITTEDFIALEKVLTSRSRTADTPEKRAKVNLARDAVRALLAHEPYADPGTIDATLASLIGHFKISWGLDVNTDSILALMAPSLDVMPADRSHEHAREKIERFYAAERQAIRDAREERIKEHFERIGQQRTEPYTAEEMSYMRERFAARSPNSTVLLCGKRLYGLTIEGYKDFGSVDLPDLQRALSPFDVEPLRADGLPRSAVSLLTECGQHANELCFTYAQAAASFDGTTLTLPTAPMRALEPRRSALVDAWLDAMCGANAPLVRQWLAWLPHTDQPLICLYLVGASGAGKSLLISGCARLWGAFVQLDHAFGSFNADLLTSPLVWGDEKFPRDNQGNYKTEEFRDFIQQRTHTINRKFRDHAKLIGYCRTALTANNENIFRVAANMLTHDDAEAIARRILRIPVLQAGRDFLRSRDVTSLIHTDEIAQHVLSLPKPKAEGQFAIASQGRELTDHLAAASNIGGRILQVCIAQILRDVREHGFIVERGAVHVLSSGLAASLGQRGEPGPSPYYLAQTLKSLAEPDKVHIKRTGVDGHFYRIRTEILLHWAETVGYDVPTIKARLERAEQVRLN
jgi:hypothetical protein